MIDNLFFALGLLLRKFFDGFMFGFGLFGFYLFGIALGWF